MNEKLVIFSLGWGCDRRVAENQVAALGGAQTMWLCDWPKALSAPAVKLARDKAQEYPERYLLAWSFGVLGAEMALAGIDFARAVAVNGTPLPADERLGIGSRRLGVTLRGLRAQGMERFLRGAYGRHYERMLSVADPRGLEANARELEFLIGQSEKPYFPSLRWDAAIVGGQDVIFPPQNMTAYWGERAKTLPLPHFPFADPGFSAELLGFEDR